MTAASTEERKSTVRESELAAWNDGDLDVFDDVYAPTYVKHDPMGDVDLTEAKETIRALRSGTPDLELRVEDLIGEGDRVVLRYTMSGTNTGPSILTKEPTGRSWEASGISIYRFEDGRIVEQWDSFDYLGVMQQLGLLPARSPT